MGQFALSYKTKISSTDATYLNDPNLLYKIIFGDESNKTLWLKAFEQSLSGLTYKVNVFSNLTYDYDFGS